MVAFSYVCGTDPFSMCTPEIATKIIEGSNSSQTAHRIVRETHVLDTLKLVIPRVDDKLLARSIDDIWSSAIKRRDLHTLDFLMTVDTKPNPVAILREIRSHTYALQIFVRYFDIDALLTFQPPPVEHKHQRSSCDKKKYDLITDDIMDMICRGESPAALEYTARLLHSKGKLTWGWVNDIKIKASMFKVVRYLYLMYNTDSTWEYQSSLP